MLIKDAAQRRRSNAPNTFGMNPFAAERLQSFGVDPRDVAETHRARQRTEGRRRAPVQPANPIVQEHSIDYRDVTTREILQQAALGSYEAEFLAEEFAPSAFVDQVKGSVILEDSTEERREVEDTASSRGQSIEAPSAVLTVNFSCVGRSLGDHQSRSDADRAPMLMSMTRLTEKTARKLKRQHEIRVMRKLTTATNYASANRRALTSGYEWNNGSSADPFADMQAVLGAMYAPATHAVMSTEAWQAVQINDDMRAVLASQINNKGTLQREDFAAYWGIPNVVVDEQRYTALGATTQSRLYPAGTLAILHVSANPLMRTFVRHFMLRGGAAGYTVLAWFDEDLGSKGSDRVKVSYDGDLVVVDDTYGGIITGLRQ
ncbi:MAG: major capsid protein [Deltaproteobacteria bacterium]|nr:major capsid protein [Myxococcales bacterium]MDP3219736.1 major capsid protein [Deltaproteobacteria bacterium]